MLEWLIENWLAVLLGLACFIIAIVCSIKGISLFSYEPEYRLYKRKWRFHKSDPDSNKTIPHGHCLDGKIDGKKNCWLYPYEGGKVYHGKVVIGCLPKKEFERLWNDEDFLKFVIGAREAYYSLNPNAKKLPPFPECVCQEKISNLQTSNAKEYEIILKARIKNEEAGE